MTRVLVLRPEPGASRTVERARRLGLEPVAIPLFKVEPVAWDAPDASGFDGLLLTSANAVHHGGEQLGRLRGLSVYAVGKETAEAARKAGFEIAATGDAGVAQLIAALRPGLHLLHPCGEDRCPPGDVQQQLSPVIVYRSKQIDAPRLSAMPAIVLIHSPRAGRRLAELVTDRAGYSIAAISRAAADAVGNGWKRVEAAAQPTDEALLALALSLCNKPHPE